MTLVRNHSLYFGRVRVADQRRGSQMALAFLLLGRQDVTQKRLLPFYLPATGLLEALGGAFMCFQFWHDLIQFSIQRFERARLPPSGPSGTAQN